MEAQKGTWKAFHQTGILSVMEALSGTSLALLVSYRIQITRPDSRGRLSECRLRSTVHQYSFGMSSQVILSMLEKT
jgi:hypothetical protein